MPELKKAELIDGIVYKPSPVSFARHGNPNSHLITWLGNYEAHTPGVAGGDIATPDHQQFVAKLAQQHTAPRS